MNHPQDIKTLGRYKILSRLGEGGMAVVYKATDTFLKRTVALKVAQVSSLDLASPESITMDRCLKEAQLAAQFIHPNIVITHDAGIEGDFFYIALEYVGGSGLETHRRKGSLLPPDQVLEIIYSICYALDYIHQEGYVHLDVKPSNIMLSERGEAKLMDFGISRILKEEPKKGAKIAGTPYYMSPEQSDPDSTVDYRTDIFSLGVVSYELLSGKRPFEGKTHSEILAKIAGSDPVALSQYNPDISPDLELIINKTMSKERSDRFNTAREFADALLPVIKGKDSRSLDKQDEKKIAYLKRLPLFRHFQHSDLMDVIKISSWSFYDKDSWIIKNDDSDN
ncbi:MAG: serine/threonine-protein kinase, partial [Desulfobacterales bacterium]